MCLVLGCYIGGWSVVIGDGRTRETAGEHQRTARGSTRLGWCQRWCQGCGLRYDRQQTAVRYSPIRTVSFLCREDLAGPPWFVPFIISAAVVPSSLTSLGNTASLMNNPDPLSCSMKAWLTLSCDGLAFDTAQVQVQVGQK